MAPGRRRFAPAGRIRAVASPAAGGFRLSADDPQQPTPSSLANRSDICRNSHGRLAVWNSSSPPSPFTRCTGRPDLGSSTYPPR